MKYKNEIYFNLNLLIWYSLIFLSFSACEKIDSVLDIPESDEQIKDSDVEDDELDFQEFSFTEEVLINKNEAQVAAEENIREITEAELLPSTVVDAIADAGKQSGSLKFNVQLTRAQYVWFVREV